MSSFNKITHVIYDMDGLLLDTEIFYTEVTQGIVQQYGKNFDWSVKSQMVGKKAIDSARILVDRLDLPITPEEYLEVRDDGLKRLFPSAQPLPGAERLTLHLARHHFPQAVATSSKTSTFELKISQHQEWFSLFQVIVRGDDPAVVNGKPAPDIFLAAAERMGADPQHCLVFEDAPAGMEGAIAAGMSVVVVPDPNMDKSQYHSAHQILDSLTEFDPTLWQLPGY